MDIEILLFLQNFRISINDALTPFMEMISLFAITHLIIIPAFVYWCIDKKSGLFSLVSCYCCNAVNAVIKLTACVYRPWIRDSRIMPAGDAISTATGYSFPSGHTSMCVPLYGSLAVKEWKKMKWVSVLCIVCMALTCFSRNYLGVHTPQDVLVGLTLGLLMIYLMSLLFRYLESYTEKEVYFLSAGIVFGVVSLIYITIKPYPMDYVYGKLLVDPIRMMRDGYGDIGRLIAFCIARMIEKRFVKFESCSTKNGLVAGLVGAVIVYFMEGCLSAPFRALLGDRVGTLVNDSLIVFFIITIWPLVIKKVSEEKNAEETHNEISVQAAE